MINQNFYLDFLIDLTSDNAEFDDSCAVKILGENINRFVSGTDLLLRYTNTEDRVLLLDAIENCLENKIPIKQFYRWETAKGNMKALEVRAEFIEPNQIVGVIIDQQINTHILFPTLSTLQLAQIKSESYLVIDRNGKIIERLNTRNWEQLPNNLIDLARAFLASNTTKKVYDEFTFFKIGDHCIDPSRDLALCILSAPRPNELINELESLLNKYRVA